ncbi:MAG: GIY-YIG nuclease family protein [Candidatus Levybacteria bacterium]|nr:GIY-YIG nuclease family protein [Candidatus Levybacteria bacterium]
MYFVYILKSQKDNKFYTGITNNIERRLYVHNRGSHSTSSTLKRGPFDLVHVETVNDRIEARRLEKYFKSGAGREIRDEIVNSWWH